MVRNRWGITPVSGLPGEDASPNVLYPEAIEGADDRVNVARRWLDDLYGALLVCVPEEYLGEDRAPWVGHPPIPASRAPWVAFASACVLYDPRAETADRFARYGGLPALESGGEGRRLEVRTPDQQREEEVAAEAREIFRELLEEKTWELRHEDLDYGRARHKVLELYGYEMWEQAKLRAEASVPEARPDEPRYYTLKFDPTQHTEKDLKLTRGAILEKEGLRHHPPGNLKQSRLLGVRVRHFLQREGWTEELIADMLNLSVERIRQLSKDAQEPFHSDPD